MKTILEKKKAILTKFYGGKREIGYHDFKLNDGKCKNCDTFIGNATMRLCPVITPEEVANFNYEN